MAAITYYLTWECQHCHMRHDIPLAGTAAGYRLVWQAFPDGMDALGEPSVMTMRDWRSVIRRAEADGWFISHYSEDLDPDPDRRWTFQELLDIDRECRKGRANMGPHEYEDSEGFLFTLWRI